MKAIDLFCGAGGFTCGAERADVSVLWAANHWEDAVKWHRANHPGTEHACQDLQQADWGEAPAHDVLLASPACQGHSRSRGKERRRHDASRSTAWAVVSCAEWHRPPVIVVENVPEFLNWSLYPAWELAMKTLGYSICPHIIDAADLGVPQNRVRVFLVLSRSRAPLELTLPRLDPVPAWEVVNFEDPDWAWSDVAERSSGRKRSLRTLDRIEQGRKDFGDRFLVPYYSANKTGRSLDRPIGTLTTKDRYAIVDGERMRMLSPDEVRRAMGFPDGYKLPQTPRTLTVHLLGNAVCPPVAKHLLCAIQAAA